MPINLPISKFSNNLHLLTQNHIFTNISREPFDFRALVQTFNQAKNSTHISNTICHKYEIYIIKQLIYAMGALYPSFPNEKWKHELQIKC